MCLALDPPPLGLMQGYQGDDGAVVPLSGSPPIAPAISRCATPTGILPMSAAPTTCSKPPTTGSARSSWKAR